MSRISEHIKRESLDKLQKYILFSGLSEQEVFMFLQFARPHILSLKEGETAKIPQSYAHMIYLALTGDVYIYTIDYDGNRSMIKYLNEGDTSGTLYSMIDYYGTEFEVFSKQDSEVLFIDPQFFYITDDRMATIQHKILVNLMATQRGIFMDISEHIACLSQRSIRDKLISFFRNCYIKGRSLKIDVPFSREELANYLAVDRASLSRSLSELKAEGIIDYNRNHFVILDRQKLQLQE